MTSREYIFRPFADWFLLDGDSDDGHRDFAALIDGFGLDDATASRLSFGLTRVWEFANASSRGGRKTWAMIRDSRSGNVNAVLTADFHKLDDAWGPDDYIGYVVAAPNASSSLEVVNRVHARTDLTAGPAILVHDFILPTDTSPAEDPAMERMICAVFPSDWPVVAEFAISTQDLTLFDDIAQYALPLFDSFVVLPSRGAVSS